MLLSIGNKELSTQMQCPIRYMGSLIRRQKIGVKCLQSYQVPAFPSAALGLEVLSEVLSSAAMKLLLLPHSLELRWAGWKNRNNGMSIQCRCLWSTMMCVTEVRRFQNQP